MNLNQENTRTAARAGSGLSRRTLLTALLGVPAIASLAAACGDDTRGAGANPPAATDTKTSETATSGSTGTGGTPGIAHPIGADDVVIRLAYVGGFVPAGYAFTEVPTVLISGDGHVYAPGVHTDIYPGPLLPAITVRTITEAGIQKVLQVADAAGLLQPPPDYTLDPEDLNVADAPDTQLTLAVDSGTFVHQAYALGLADPAESKVRNVLNGVAIQVADLEQYFGADILGPEAPFVPTAYRMQAVPLAPGEVPSSTGGPAPTFVEWPSSIGVALADAAECAVVPADAAGTIFSDADQLTYFTEKGVVYFVSAVATLPGDTC